MSLTIKDGLGTNRTLKTGEDGSDLVPYHAISGTIPVTSSQASPLFVTGTVTINQPVNVDLVVGDALTASVTNTVVVTSSNTSPVYVSSSQARPVYVTGNLGSVTLGSELALDEKYTFWLSGTEESGSYGLNVKEAFLGKVENRRIDYGVPSTSGSHADIKFNFNEKSGSFPIAEYDEGRVTLTIYNPSTFDLYVSLHNYESRGITYGFILTSTASIPNNYSFVIGPQGTYTSERGMGSLPHSGFFVSQSNVETAHLMVTRTYLESY